MAIPTTRQEFKDYCMRKLGAPVLDIELDEEQIDDRVDEALKYYRDYHFDGSEKIYLKHQVQQTDIDNGYFDIGDPDVFAISYMFPIGNIVTYSTNMFSLNYQIALNDIWNLSSFSLIPYYLAREQLSLIQELLVGKQPIRFNQHTNKIYTDMTPENLAVGQWLVFEGYKLVDPDTNTSVWSDRWLQNYCTILLKEQWAGHLTKYKDAQLISGMKFNAERILDDAQRERKKMEDEMIYTYSLPVYDQIG